MCHVVKCISSDFSSFFFGHAIYSSFYLCPPYEIHWFFSCSKHITRFLLIFWMCLCKIECIDRTVRFDYICLLFIQYWINRYCWAFNINGRVCSGGVSCHGFVSFSFNRLSHRCVTPQFNLLYSQFSFHFWFACEHQS